MPLRSIVVDDEPQARALLERMLAAHHDVELIGCYGDGSTAVKAIMQHHPELVFLDIEMPRWSGLQVLTALGEALPPAVVFVTAFDDYAVRAFDLSATDYLLKPFDHARLARAMERARARVRAAALDGSPSSDDGARLGQFVEQLRARDDFLCRFAVESGKTISLIQAQDVAWFEADGRMVRLHVEGSREPHLIRYTMQALERGLDPRRFARISRSAIVNIDHVRHLETWTRGEYVFVLRTGHRIVSTHTYRSQVEAVLGRRGTR